MNQIVKIQIRIVLLILLVPLTAYSQAEDVDTLIQKLKDEDSDVRRYAAMALGKLKDSRAVEPLIAVLKDENSDVRMWAAMALGKLKDSRAVEPLIVALKDEESSVRIEAAIAMGMIKDPRAVEPLIAALKDNDLGVRAYAEIALRMITGKDFGEMGNRGREIGDRLKIDNLRAFPLFCFFFTFCGLI